jgi:predicted small metal-binding protein
LVTSIPDEDYLSGTSLANQRNRKSMHRNSGESVRPEEVEMIDNKIDNKSLKQIPNPGNNPNVQSSDGGINPSAPSTGTAGWGTTRDEKRKQVSQNLPEASSPNAQGAGDVRHTSYPQNEAAQNPAARNLAEQERPRQHGDRSFRCADAVREDCGWSVTGNNEEEILGYLRSHAREAHGKNEFTPQELANARKAIHKRAA